MTDRNSQGRAAMTLLDWLGLAAAIAFVLGPLLAWLRAIPALPAFYLFTFGGLLSVLAGVSALVQAARGRGFGAGRTAALLAGMVFVVTAATQSGGPMTNDFTTDLEEPPTFENALTLPQNAGRDMAYDPGFAAEQRKCCGDLASVEIPMPPGEAFQLALEAARGMAGWKVLWDDSASGRIEAVAMTPVFGFEDDIAIRVRGQDSGSRLDIRSKSRDGRGDIGANAARIRAYVATVEASR